MKNRTRHFYERMELAKKWASLQSEDPHTKTAAIWENKEGDCISVGWNELPYGGEKNGLPLTRDGEWLNTKYPYIIHAEVDCIIKGLKNDNFDQDDYNDSTLYVTLFPCNECAKVITMAGIKRVVYEDDRYMEKDFSKAAMKIFDACGIEVIKLERESAKDVRE